MTPEGRCPRCGDEAPLNEYDWPPTPCPSCTVMWLLEQGIPRLIEKRKGEDE